MIESVSSIAYRERSLIKRGGGMCPMKPGNRQWISHWNGANSHKAYAL